MPDKFPDNFTRLHRGEEIIRGKSVEAIEADENLLTHATLIEAAMDLIDYFCRQHIARDEGVRKALDERDGFTERKREKA